MKSGDIIAGRYRLAEPIGEGGLGVVWTAWQLGIERRVAIKFLKGGRASDQQRFDIEARALGRLSHPNCVTVHDFGHMESGELFLVMEHLEGCDLASLRGTHLPIPDVVAIAQQIVTALAYAHHQGVVHRDLKPENVFLVDTFDGEQLVKVLDFGLAKLIGRAPSDITKTGDVFGTPAYMSPEQLQGTKGAGRASDLYSVGVMLYEMIDRRLPFWAETPLEIGMAHIMKPAPPIQRQGVPEALLDIVERLLRKDPAARFDSALRLFDALGEVEVPDVDSTLNLVMVESPHHTLDMPGGLQTSPESITAIERIPDTVINYAAESATVAMALPTLAPQPEPTVRSAETRLQPPASRVPGKLVALAAGAALFAVLAVIVLFSAGKNEETVAPDDPVATAQPAAPTDKAAAASSTDMGRNSVAAKAMAQTAVPPEPAVAKPKQTAKKSKPKKAATKTKPKQKAAPNGEHAAKREPEKTEPAKPKKTTFKPPKPPGKVATPPRRIKRE